MSISPACQNVIAKVKRNAVRIAGVNGIRALSRCLGVTDDYSADVFKCATFVDRITAFGIHLSPEEQAALWQWLDRTVEGIVCPTEFITALRHIDSGYRRSMVARVIRSFARNPHGHISTAAIRERFDASRHPQVMRDEVSKEEVQRHITDVFSSEANPAGWVSASELEQYFSGLSAVVDTDQRFAALLRGCWRLPHFDRAVTDAVALREDGDPGLRCQLSVNEKTAVLLRATRQKALVDTVAAHRRSLIDQAAGFRALGTALRRNDPSSTGFVSKVDFFEALASVRLYVERDDVLDFLDVNENGSMDYEWYLHEIVGELTSARKLAAERLWIAMPIDSEGCVDLAWVHKHYVTHDPTELSVFYDAWDQRKANASSTGRKRVSEFEFIAEWLVPLSAGIKKDMDFAKKLSATWPIDELDRIDAKTISVQPSRKA